MKVLTATFFITVCVFGPSLKASPEGPVYDAKGQLTEYHYADGTKDSYVYDNAWRMIRFIDRNGKTTTFVYNSDGSMKTTFPDGTTQN